MGISSNGALSKYISADDYVWKVPDNLTLEDVATVPLAYAVAYLAVIIKGEMQSNKSVFVCNGASSFGQAATNLTLNIKFQVFAGHDNDIEKEFLRNNYPNIPENQIISTTEGYNYEKEIVTNNCKRNYKWSCKAASSTSLLERIDKKRLYASKK